MVIDRTFDIGPLLRRVGATATTTATARGVLLLGTLGTVPIVLRMVGTQQLGIWLTLVTVTSLLGFADLGLGNGIMTAIARARAGESQDQLRVILGNGLALLALVSAILMALLALTNGVLEIETLFGLSNPDAGASQGINIFIGLFLLGIPFTAVDKLEWGLQRGWIAGAWALAGSVGAVAGILVTSMSGYGLTGLAVSYTGVPLVASLANTFWALGRRWPHLRPRWSDISLSWMRSLLSVGGLYFALQLAAAIAFSSDNFIVALRLGPDQVPDLAVPARLFGLVTFGLSIAVRPLWPEYAYAIGKGHIEWVRRNTLISLALATLTAAVLGLLLVATGDWLLTRLTDGTVGSPLPLMAALAMSTVLVAAGNAVAMLYNAIGEVRFQVLTALAMAFVVVTLKILLVQPLGVLGVALGGVIGYGAISGTAFVVYTPRLFARLSEMRTGRSEDRSGS